MHTKEEKLQEFGRLLDVLDCLRAECPWDREQTFDSLRPLTVEETFELADAVFSKDMLLIKKELGDVLLHILFYSKIGDENGEFDIFDVCKALTDKLIYRHPHVFGKVDATTAETVSQNWEKLKLKEKDGNRSVLAGVPHTLPALIKAYRIQDKARSAGFDWEQPEQVWDKVNEEMNELQAEIAANDADKTEAEFGDLLFSVINAARLHGVNPENALERTNRKFIKRFNFLEANTLAKGIDLKKMTLAQMDEIWEKAKNID
ncbi:MAG: nucleoside triphosphate pyrophosphohydrolase [Paludibacter sp.]|nr:nucleoside triphosphate pyrophosphohydrolase [Paludibacter sp.]